MVNEFEKDNRVMYAHENFHTYHLSCMHGVPPIVGCIDAVVQLGQVSVYPNPSRLSDIGFKLSESQSRNQRNGEIEISIYNVKGQLVKSSTNFFKSNTDRVFVWDRKDNKNKYVASGVYTYKIKSSDNVYTGKVLIVK